jgi:hypothetical protein
MINGIGVLADFCQTLIVTNEFINIRMRYFSCNVFHVFCIRTRIFPISDALDSKLLLDQVKAFEFAKTAKIRKLGFPVHQKFKDFVARYRCLTNMDLLEGKTAKECAYQILATQGLQYSDQYQLGTNLVFFSADAKIREIKIFSMNFRYFFEIRCKIDWNVCGNVR